MPQDWSQWDRVVILSPHLDDAVFSCFGLMQSEALRHSPLIITIFAGDANRSIEERHGIELPSRRRGEDANVMAYCSAQFVHFGFQDAIDRCGKDGQLLYPRLDLVFGSPHGDDLALVDRIARALSPLCQGVGNVLVVAPLGIGFHVDHKLVALAAQRVSTLGSLLFYEDFPYVVAGGLNIGLPDSSSEALGRLGLVGAQRIGLTYEFDSKVKAMDGYGSQIQMVFGGRNEMLAQMRNLSLEGKPAEYYWRAQFR